MENEVKEPAPKYNYIWPQQYLEMERASEEKHEYYKGEVFPLFREPHSYVKGSARVNILNNIDRLVAPLLQVNEDNEVYADNLTNPSAIIEIISNSIKNGRGNNFALYRKTETLNEYILIDSASINIEIFTRQPNNSWLLTEFKQRSDSFYISTIGLNVFLKDVYDDVSFEE